MWEKEKAEEIDRRCSRYVRQAHFITCSEKGLSEHNGKGYVRNDGESEPS
jgi:hypothetical protein